jgi:lantibiotic biosynthesis protein
MSNGQTGRVHPDARDEIGTVGPAASAAGPTAWIPIIDGPTRVRALAAVDELTTRIDAASAEIVDGSLSSGAAGLAVFYAELERAAAAPDARVDAKLEHTAELLGSKRLPASLFAGFSGMAWAAEVVGNMRGSRADVNADIDDAVLQVLARVDSQHAPYDLIFGLTGLGLYAAARWPRPAAVAALERVVTELSHTAREDEDGVYWWTPPALLLGRQREQYPNGGVNLGVAHGVAGVVPLLARASALGVVGEAALSLAGRAVSWLVAHAIESENGPTVPYFADAQEPVQARLAWCYGDPGVAAALVAAGHDARVPMWLEVARELALAAAARAADSSGVTDAGVCHGSAGLAHLFNRMYQAQREPWLLEAARFWIDQTLERLSAEETPYNGFGLLEGAAGVALVLSAAASEIEPCWDRMFLIAPLQSAAEVAWAGSRSVAAS